MRRIISLILTLVILVSVVAVAPFTASAATSLPDSIYIQQGYPATCTLAASTMMLRSRMYLSGNSGWSSVTEDSLLPVAWISKVGLRHSFTYNINGNSMSVAHSYTSGISVGTLKWLLDTHPEGIVLYCGNLPHAVFVTDYEGDTFYCADSAGSPYSGKRLPLASSLVGYHYGAQANILANTTAYWYVSSYNITPSATNVDLGDDFYGMIIHQPGGKSIGQADNGNVQLIYESPANMDHILWHFTKNSDGSYKIKSMLNGMVLDVANASTADNANVQCVNENGSDAQKWYVSWNVVNSSFFLRAKCTSKVMDLTNGDWSEGNNIQMYTQSSHEAQRFTIHKLTADYKVNYTLSVNKQAIDFGDSVNLSVLGDLPYVYNFEFHIIDAYGEETVIDNKCSSVLNFTPEKEGTYTVFAKVKNPLYTDEGSITNKSATFTVGCGHKFEEKFVEATSTNSQGYVHYTCTECGESYKDSFMEYKNGYYYTDNIPDVIKRGDYEIEYNNYYEKVQKDSPGEGYVKGEVVKNEWVNKGEQYTTYIAQPTSDSRVLVQEYYYHWCIPGAGKDSEGNYEATATHSHYDQISLPNEYVYVDWTGDDNGHPVYMLNWTSGPRVYCKSGEQCDGSWGYHDYRCKAWYKNYVYQDREKIELYKYTKESGWINSADSTATSTSIRFKAPGGYALLGDVDKDNKISVMDATEIQLVIAQLSLNEINSTIADVDKDKSVSVMDATNIQCYVAQLPCADGIGERI